MTRTRCFGIAALALLITWSASASAKGEWSLESRSNGIVLYSQEVKGSSMDSYRGVMTLPYSPEKVMTILGDVQSFRHITPDLVEVRLLAKEDKPDGTVIGWVYQRLDFSGIDDRDYVIRATTRKKTTKLGDQWQIHFRTAQDKGPRPQSDVVRVTRLTGGWLLRPLDGGSRTHLTYVRHIELGGSVPHWLASSGVEDSMVLSLQNLRKYCKRQLGQ